MSEHPYGWLSLAPPLVAIVLAIVTRKAAWSLLAGVVVGALILAGGNPVAAVPRLLETHLWGVLTDDAKMRVFAFTLLMGAMVGVVAASGGMRGLVEAIAPRANTRRRGQLVTWLLGLIVFFDDYANTVLLGSTLRPLTDRLKISRAKLAYLVDSTSAPVAGLALVSTWVAGEIEFVQSGIDKIEGVDWQAFSLFVSSIPYRFYVWWALLMVPLVAVLRRDFAPMSHYERECLLGKADSSANEATPTADEQHAPTAHWLLAVVPIVVTVAAIVTLLMITGQNTYQQAHPGEQPSLMQMFGAANANSSLLWGSLVGLLVAVALSAGSGALGAPQITQAAMRGASTMLPALVILWLASSLSGMTGNKPTPADASGRDLQVAQAEAAGQQPPPEADFQFASYRLYTGEFLGKLVGDRLPPWSLPTVIFVVASAIAFATGTSWGTMGIVMPLAVPLAYGVLLTARGDGVSPDDPILLCTVGSVLAGSIFGDHCSPISDTTVLSSQASGCDHITHVGTQLPYALVVAAITIVCGTLPVGLGISLWLLWPLGFAMLVFSLWLFGQTVE